MNSMAKFFIITVLFFPLMVISQSLSTGDPVLEDFYRRQQLIGKLDLNKSFSIRPFNSLDNEEDVFDPIDSYKNNKLININPQLNWGYSKGFIKVLPFNIIEQYTSHHPEGYNDGAMIPARGWQTYISGGLYFKYKLLSIQLKPEFVTASNKSFLAFPYGFNGVLYDSPTPNMDYPERFGNSVYSKVFPGESSIRLTFGAFSFGLSSEKLWWGPGMKNSLLMTNTAPGFLHFTFNSIRPVNIGIGSLEWQLIGGKLEASGYIEDLPDDWRYLNAAVISYQPKWIPGLFLGAIRSFQIYRSDMGGGVTDYLPVFTSLGKNSAGASNEDEKRRDQLLSVFFRWVWPESYAEIYAEYGRNDHAWNTRDLIVEAEHSSAYIIGFRKLIPLNLKRTFINVNLEITQLEANPVTVNRDGGSWYVHNQVVHGYTHYGQLLGAGIGPGSNLQSLKVNWVKDLKSIGLLFERYVHNNDFWFKAVKDIRANWVDMSITAFGRWDYRNLLLSMDLRFVKAFNYQWIYNSVIGGEFWDGDGLDKFNFQAKLGIAYRF